MPKSRQPREPVNPPAVVSGLAAFRRWYGGPYHWEWCMYPLEDHVHLMCFDHPLEIRGTVLTGATGELCFEPILCENSIPILSDSVMLQVITASLQQAGVELRIAGAAA